MQGKAMTRSKGSGNARRRIGNDRLTFANAGLALMLAAGAASAQSTTWSSAVDGTWGDSAKWSDNVPNNNAANLTPTAASYTVTVDAVPANPCKNLTVTNAPANTTTLNVNADGFKSNDGLIMIGRGATVEVNSDGVMTYDGSDTAKTIVEIKDGGVWHVNGGSVAFTNLYQGVSATARTKTISIGLAGSEGTLKISSGDFRFIGQPTTDNKNFVVIKVGADSGSRGKLEMTGGSLVMAGNQASYNSYFQVGGTAGAYGEVLLSGNASLISSNQFDVGRGGTGVVSLAGNSVLRQSVTCRNAIGDREGSPGTINVSDNATLDMSSNSSYTGFGGYMGSGTQAGGPGIVSFANNSTGIFNIVHLGVSAAANKTGYGEMNISGGWVNIVNAMHIGHGYAANATGTGVVSVTGGTLYLAGGNGLSIGSARGSTFAADGAVGLGALHLSGNGLVQSASGWPKLGSFPGSKGVVTQTSGNFIVSHTDATRPVCIGHAGGEGTYRISGGVFSSTALLFVGGYSGDGGSGSQGLLEITGGSFSVTNTVTVGQNGTGRVVIGAAGSLYASSLSMQGATSTLRLECGPTGVGSCTVAGELTVGSGAKLEVDASLFEPDSTTELILAQYGSRSAPFATGDITLVTGSRPAEILQTDTQIVLKVHGSAGTLITIR